MTFSYESIFTVIMLFFIIMLIGLFLEHFKYIITNHFKYTIQIISVFTIISCFIILLTYENIKLSNSLLLLSIIFNVLLTSLFVIMGLYFSEKIDPKDNLVQKSLFAFKLNIDFGKFAKYLMIFLIINVVFTTVIINFIGLTLKDSNNLNSIYNLENLKKYPLIKRLIIDLFCQIQIAMNEEIIFRLCFMNFIIYFFNANKKKYWIGIIVSSLFFALSHYQLNNEPITKFIQILPLGIGFGIIYRDFGLECSFLSHLSFNIIIIFINGFTY